MPFSTRASLSTTARFVLLFAAVTFAFSRPERVLAQTPEPAAPARAKADRWEEAITRFEAQDAETPPKPGGVVFVGSSSIRLWDLKESFPELNAVNRGFGGSQIADATRYAHRIVTPHQPRLIVLYAGDNDLAGGKSPEQVVEDFRAFVQKVREKSPESRIAFLSIKPSLARWRLIDQVRQANRAIAEIAAGDDRLEYVDLDAPMIGPDGLPRKELFRPDGLHLNAEGYKVWSEQLRPLLSENAAGE